MQFEVEDIPIEEWQCQYYVRKGELIMALRFLHATPQQLLEMSSSDLLTAIRISEGRTIMSCARTRCGNLVDYVSNAELAAAFGADIIMLDTYEPANPYIPGWPSKDPADDEITKDIQVPKGKGYSLKEIRRIVGRPVAVLLVVHSDKNKAGAIKHYGNILASAENAKIALESGADMVTVTGWAPLDILKETLDEIRKVVKGNAIFEYSRPHGPGLIGQSDTKLGPSGLISDDEIRTILDSGVDVLGLPAPGTYPGFTVELAGKYVEMIHNAGVLASLGLHTSQEGSDIDTIKRIAILAKEAGADMHELGDSGFNEAIIEPLNIMNYSIAIRGRRHTYRRMAMSIKR